MIYTLISIVKHEDQRFNVSTFTLMMRGKLDEILQALQQLSEFNVNFLSSLTHVFDYIKKLTYMQKIAASVIRGQV